MLEQEIFIQKNRPGIAKHGIRRDYNLVASQREQGGSAQRLSRNIGDGVSPTQIPQTFRDADGGFDLSARTVDLDDHQVRIPPLCLVQFAVEILLAQRVDQSMELDQRGAVPGAWRATGSSPRQHACQHGQR